MTDEPPRSAEDLAAAIADGRPVDWEAVARSKTLLCSETGMLRCIEAICRDQREGLNPLPALPIETGFDIQNELGHGSFGTVYSALDRALGRAVALKVLRTSVDIQHPSRERFLREARALAAIEHNNVVKLWSIGEHADRLVLALERIEGETLERIVRSKGPLSPAEAIRIALDLCAALGALHRKGLIHRDLKPGNVMRERGGRVVLLDFGLVASPDVARDEAVQVGTPTAMAPEQFAAPEHVGPFTDVFALGVLVYYLLTGAYPFDAPSVDAIRDRVMRGAPVPLLDMRPDVPIGLARVMAKAIATRTADRFQSAGEMADALREQLGADPRRRWPILRWLGVAVGMTIAATIVSHWRRSGDEDVATATQSRVDVRWQLASGEPAAPPRDVSATTHVSAKTPSALYLVLEADVDTYVYVFVEANPPLRLFPLDWLKQRNPIPPGRCTLPGQASKGSVQQWRISWEAGEAEQHLIAFVATTARADLEGLLSWTDAQEPRATRGVKLEAAPIACLEPSQRSDRFHGMPLEEIALALAADGVVVQRIVLVRQD